MPSALTWLWIIADLVTLAATIVVIVELRRAPKAREEERGLRSSHAHRATTRETVAGSDPMVGAGHARLA